MMRIMFVAKLHEQNGYSFYLPTKLIRWLGVSIGTYNNVICIKKKPSEEWIKIDGVSMTRHKDTYKGSFYLWRSKVSLRVGVEYLFSIDVPLK